MMWVILIILAVVAYFGYKGLHSRHVARCRYDERTHENVPESISEQAEHKAFHEKNAAMSDQRDGMPAEPVAAQRGGPSLLYAERDEQQAIDAHNAEVISNNNSSVNESSSNDVSNDPVSSSANTPHQASLDLAESSGTKDQWQEKANDSMDFTAETATLSSDEVGTPANSSDYDEVDSNQINTNPLKDEIPENTVDKKVDTIHESVEADQSTTNSAKAAQSSNQSNNSNAGIAAAGVAAAAAGIGIAKQNATKQESSMHNWSAERSFTPSVSTGEIQQIAQPKTAFAEGIDLELGDSTLNEANEDLDENDELLDFGDLTADISEMLKELNLREGDSPRLEINQDEFAQLKTGEPGQVKPEKIENVADKLRNMLQ